MSNFPTAITITTVSSASLINFNNAFRLLRPVIISEGDRYRVTHKNTEVVIPLSKHSKLTTGFSR